MEKNERNQWKGIERRAERRVGKVKVRFLFIVCSKMEKNERNRKEGGKKSWKGRNGFYSLRAVKFPNVERFRSAYYLHSFTAVGHPDTVRKFVLPIDILYLD
jgi:hypothetical protein